MTTIARTSPDTSTTDSEAIVRMLRANPFVKEASSPQVYHYIFVLALQGEVVQVLIDYLSDSGFLRIGSQAYPNEVPTITIYSPDADAERIGKELDRAFRKVSQFLEYQELKKEYASGQVPRHLCQWLLEGGF